MAHRAITLDGNSLTIEDVACIARDTSVTVQIAPGALQGMNASRHLVDEWVERAEVVYA